MEFRRSLAASFLFRFFLLSSYQLAADAETFQHSFPETFKSATKVCNRAIHRTQSSRSLQTIVISAVAVTVTILLCLSLGNPHGAVFSAACRVGTILVSYAICCAQPYERPPARGIQCFSGVPDEDVVGKPYRHMAADMQVIAPFKFHSPKLVLPQLCLHFTFDAQATVTPIVVPLTSTRHNPRC